MDIEIPPGLQWISYLAGGEWPQGSETRTRRLSEYYQNAAEELKTLIPELNRVRGETLSVLFGETADAADKQFAMLFDGDYAVDKLVDGLAAMGDGASYFGTEIEYNKLSIIVGLILAAAEISWCLANAGPTAGVSLSAIPAIEMTTAALIRRLIMEALERILMQMRAMLTRTGIKTLLPHVLEEAFKETGQELAQGLLQEGIVQGIQAHEGHADYRWDRFGQTAIASSVGGGMGGASAVPVAFGLSGSRTKLGNRLAGITTMFTAGITGNIAGSLSVGGGLDTVSILAGATSTSIGGIKGMGGGRTNGTDPDNGPDNRSTDPPSQTEPTGPTPDDLADADPDAEVDEPPDTTGQQDDTRDDTEGRQSSGGSRATPTSTNTTSVKGAVAQHDPSSSAQGESANQNSVDDDRPTTSPESGASQREEAGDRPDQEPVKAVPESSQDADESTAEPPERAAPTHEASDQPHQPPERATPENSVTDSPAAQNGHLPESHDPTTSDMSTVAEPGPETTIEPAADPVGSADPSTDTTVDTVDTVDIAETTQAQHQVSPAAQTPSAPANAAGQAPASNPPAGPATPAPKPAAPAAPVQSRDQAAAEETSKVTGENQVSAASSTVAAPSENAGIPAARVQDSAATSQPSAAQQNGDNSVTAARADGTDTATDPTTETSTDNRPPPNANCANNVADQLTNRYRRFGRIFRIRAEPTSRGVRARALFEAAGSSAEFATYADIEARLKSDELGPGSAAIITSAWAGGPNQGGHAYLAVNDGDGIYLLDGETGERLGWPPSWGGSAVSLTAVGYLDAHGEAVSSPGNGPTGLVAADAVGYVRGHRDDGDTSANGERDPGDRWRDAVPPHRRAETALSRRVPPLDADHVDQLRNPLGSMEAADARARSNATWWATLTGDEQRALIDTYPRHIGNAEGIPADARHEANRRSLDQSRRQLQSLRDDGHRLSRSQRKLLARLDRIEAALTRSDHLAQQADVGGPRLLAFDPTAFGGDGRAVVSFGADPYRAQSVSWHIPGQGMTIDQLGYCMGDALNHLRSTMQENPELSAASIAWIGYDTPSGLSSWRAAGHSLARQGGANLYSDIRAFNAARDTRAGDDSHFSENHVFAHSYGSTAASYAGRDGRLANDIRTISLAGSPGAGPVRTASEFGLGDNVYVASSSRDPFTALGGRAPGSGGRIFGIGLGVDPAMDTFGGQRVTAEFSSDMDRRQSRGTHNSYYRFANRGTDPPVRSESLANFGRIAAGHADRIDTEQHRTADERPRRFFGTRQRTVEPAVGRPLRLDGEASARGDRETRRWWNPRWADEVQATDAAAQLEPGTPEQVAQDALEQRGVAAAADLVSPADHNVPVREAVARARRNAQWWAGLSPDQQQALIDTHPFEIGNAEGIPPTARNEANQKMLRRYLAHRDLLVSRRDNGVALSAAQERYVKLMNDIDAAMRTAERNVEKFGMRDQGPYLLALDPRAFGGVGRAIVSFGANPYTAQSVSWYVPGMSTTIDKLALITNRAFNQLRSVQQENPDLSVASIAYIGYRAPGSWDAKVLSQRLAREGGEIFCSDISAFNAGRDVFTGDGSHFSGNHVFAHSYGSSTVSHAGSGRRLADQVRTITLIGSPGAGPMRHASQFGIGDNVFVAASSRDPVTGFGGERPGLRSRFNGRTGQGVDPAMHEFGARRITAEFPAAIDHRGAGSRMTHSLYWAYMDPGTTQVRSESLASFGRIAAGRTDQVDHEGHRTIDRRPRRFLGGSRERTFEPAIGRPLRLGDDPHADHSVRRRHVWNPRFRNSPVIATDLTDPLGEISADERLDGVPDNALSEDEQERSRNERLAETALNRGGLTPSSLMSPADHKVPVREAVARARRNAQWWAGLSPDQQQALIDTHPFEIGNAEGIPPMARNEANQKMLRRYLAHRDLLVSRRDNGVALNSAEVRYVDLMHEIDNGLQSAERRLAQLGLHDQGPYLLALDPRAFGGAGRAIVSFGANPYTAQSVSWYVPGMTTTIEKMRAMALRGINQLQSTLQENPDLSAASITYIGYRAPGSWDPRVGFQRMARQGGNIFCSDLLAFNAGRDVFTGDGSHFSGNHVFAHSYGSSTVSHAGSGRRLAGHVRTITMIGSPGAGPLRTARDFGIGDNVFVAASSRDRTTGLGGERLGARGRIFRRMGQGIDPAMDIFRARRITAEFPAVLDHMGPGSRMTHSLYWAYMDPGSTRVRSEALTNFGRIAAGRADQVDTEGHRTLDRRPRRLIPGVRERSVEPALGRPLRLADDPNTYHSVHGRNRWNPNFQRSTNCAQFVVDELNRRYPGRNFTLPTEPSARGVPARSLFQAIGSSAQFTSYDEIPAMLEELGIGSSAVLASRWSGRSQGGHAYFAVKVGPEIDDIIVVDSHSGETTGWPPKWGEGAVRRTAVGYLRADGSALDTLTGDTGLADADRIGHVQGSPVVDDNLSPGEQALALRVPRVQPDELRNPLGNAEEAAARARNNATWWQRLSPQQRQDVIDAYPEHIGNAEGIPAKVRDEANRNVLKQLRDRADRVQTKIDEFERPTRAERKFLAKFNRLDQALQKAATDAQRAGQDAPMLLAFDPVEFGGDGRAVLSFGHDPYSADSVSWHVPGVQTTLNSLFGFYTHSALNHLQSVQQENPGLKASSIAWIGYDTPSGLNLWRAAGHQLARTGGDTLFSDITAFNAVRETADGNPFTGNHVFGYSYGSTTTGYAGRGGRLADHVSTISLVGSPGVGPVRYASEFGIGEGNVFVAASSQDVVTMLGGRTPGSAGRILGIGLGVNPAMNSFGAVRMTAEFPSTMSHLRTGGTHHAYYLHTGQSERSESLANLGRIAAGQPERVDVEQHRTAGRWRTVEPAAGRRTKDCALQVAHALSVMFGLNITIDAEPTSRGVPARSLFEAINSSAQFATYEDIENALLDPDNPATVAVLASSWNGRGQGGHAYLAVNEGGTVYLVDPHSGKRSGWPPYWGEDAVKRTAVGYLRANGKPVTELHGDTTGQLADADKIGHVQGHRDTSDFARLQAEYRAQDPATRHVDTRYAQRVGEVVDNTGDVASARQLAQDLSGIYGPYRIELEALRFGSEVRLTGKIFNGDTEIGTIQRIFDRDGNGKLVAHHTGLVIKDTQLQGQGFSRSLSSELERWYVDSGVDRIELTTHAQGGAAWADRHTWNPDSGRLQESIDRVKMAAGRLSHVVSDEAKALLGEIVQRLETNHPRLPEPGELRGLATAAEPNLGRRLLASVGNIKGNDNLHYVRYLPVAEETPQPRTGFLARLKSSLGFGNKPQNCAHRVAAALSARYPGRDFRVAVAPSRTGVPAWALFQAVGSRAEFASYDDVRNALLFDDELGNGSSAVLTSRWADGRQGGHAYLAVNDGGEVYLLDLESGQRSDWPPSWGEGAVDRTAVGYIRPNGTALHGLGNAPLQVALAHADAVGDVQGVPSDPDFLARQAEYRAQDHRTRRVDTRYAEPLGELVDSLDPARARRFADDLSGVYGPHPVEMFRAEVDEQFHEIIVGGHIMSGDEPIGFVQLTFNHDSDGNLVAHVNVVEIFDEKLRRAGFLTALMAELEPCLTRNGFHRIELRTEQNGGYAFARLDFTWNPDPQKLQRSLDSIKSSADQLREQVSPAGQAVLDDIVQRLEPGHPDLPKPAELAVLATRDESSLGRDLLTGTYWNGVKYLRADDQVASYPSPDDVELAGFWDRIGGLDSATLTPEMLVDAVYQSVPTDTVTGFYEGRISGFKTGEVVRAQQHVADTMDNAYFVSADIANLRGLNQACADRTEANAHFAGLSAIFRAGLEESGLVVVPMRIGGDELGAVVVGDVDETLIESMVALIRAQGAEYARQHNLADIAHPKHPGQPQYNGVGLHIGYAEVLPGLEVRDIFDAADLGVDRSKTRSSDVTGGQGRATGTDGAESGGTGTSDRGAGTRTGREATGGESEAAGSTGREEQGARQPLSGSGYSQPDEVKRASFAAEAERVCGQGTQALAGLFEPLRRDEVSGFYDGRSAHFKTSEVARARVWIAETGQAGFFVSAMLSNLSGLNQHVQNRAEAANGHYRAITEMFLAALEATGAAVVPMRTGGDRLDAVVVGEIDSAAIDDATAAVAEMIAIYTQDEGLADIANPSNAGRPGVHLNLGYSDIASHGDVEDVIQAAEQQMFDAVDSLDLADQALAQRDSQFAATDLVHSDGAAQSAAELAEANALWWKGLSDAERQALIEKYPAQIGNSEGIPPLDRHQANTRALQDWLHDRDELQAMSDRGVRLGHVKSTQLDRMNRVDDALRRAADAAREAQVDGPYLLRFDPDALSGAGIAMVSFGADPHLAESVSWHVPGRGTTIDHLGAGMGSALNHLRSVRHEDPNVAAASMTWIGYDTLADDAPQAGGRALYADIRAFNAGRDALAEDGSHFSNNHVFGHCQGSTVSGHAGEGGRLRGQVRTVTLIGSPGVPMDHASAFGSGVAVYVAASTLDDFTWDGGRTPGAGGTFRNGYGVDPTMEFFGAQRITAEYPLSLVAMGHEFDAHNSYYRFVDKSTGQRNESLANFGRIAAGHPGRLQFEGHRAVVARSDGTTTIDDPAAVRAIEVEDPGPPAAEANHSDDRDSQAAQQEYRNQDRATRTVDSRYAEPLGDVIDNLDEPRLRQLAEDLSGEYGPYRVELFPEFDSEGRAGYLHGVIYSGDTEIGYVDRSFYRDDNGKLVVYNGLLEITNEVYRGKGFSKAFAAELERYYMRSGVDRIELTSSWQGSNAWARRGFTWQPDNTPLQRSLDAVKRSAEQLRSRLSAESQMVLDEMLARLEIGHPRLSEPIDLALLHTADDSELGWFLLDNTSIYFAKYFPAPVDVSSGALDGDVQETASQNCAHGTADLLSARYPGRDFTIGVQPSRTGVPARALFEAIGSASRYATYAQIEATLKHEEMGDGSAAVVVSRWRGGRAGGHAYLAVNDGGEVYLLDPETGERSGWPPHWGADGVDRIAVGYLDSDGNATIPLDDVPFRLNAADAVGDVRGMPGDPLAALGLPDYAPGSLSEREALTVFNHGEHGMRELNAQLIREGIGAEERARQLSDIRNSLRARTYELMSNRAAADWLSAHTPNPTFEELVARNQEKGLVGDEVYEAIVETATHSHFAPGTLSDVETTELYSQFELGLRSLNEQMIRDGISAEQRARELSGLRSSLRAWTRELMENRPAAEWMAAYERNPTFDDLVARYERKGLSGDAVYEAIIDGATHSHYATATLSDEETRTVYTTLELKMREIRDKLLRDGVGAEERARTMYGLRATIRSWTRALMQNRELADDLNANERNPTFEELVEKNRARGKVGDEIYEAIVESSTRSRGSVNESLGIDPENPPDLPPMRGPADPDGDTGEDSYDR
ncbi:alpha/beta hydrolase [Mycolicibacterium sp. 050232]|uniref:alpha/beta hydrolase n=1 Tax=Mycolicibacterium sp. 050232 TaxID=3113982 RepID=UPI002E2A7951|nr:alpha/beta hydrolase [Mycolicibacterium sp. 050232]MED5814292.1 alpha/beta hydrolase [Mycolicibacterium sp. 050232]